MASILHESKIDPFDSQEAKPYKQDPEIVAMTNLVNAFWNRQIKVRSDQDQDQNQIRSDQALGEKHSRHRNGFGGAVVPVKTRTCVAAARYRALCVYAEYT